MRVKRSEGKVCCKCGGELPPDWNSSQVIEISRRKTVNGTEVLLLAKVCGSCHKPSLEALL